MLTFCYRMVIMWLVCGVRWGNGQSCQWFRIHYTSQLFQQLPYCSLQSIYEELIIIYTYKYYVSNYCASCISLNTDTSFTTNVIVSRGDLKWVTFYTYNIIFTHWWKNHFRGQWDIWSNDHYYDNGSIERHNFFRSPNNFHIISYNHSS